MNPDILRYTVTNPTSLHNFYAAGSSWTYMHNKVDFHCLLKGNCQKCIRKGITIFKIFIWGGISSDILSEISF